MCIEKEVRVDFRLVLQMVPCTTKYDIEKLLQKVYTISKFREFQQEFTAKVYCQVRFAEDFCRLTKYEVRDDIILDGGMKKKNFTICFCRDICKIECSYHLFEFRGIIYRHTISVLIQNDVSLLPDKYALRRWMQDVDRLYTKVPTMYNDLVSTAEQLRYE